MARIAIRVFRARGIPDVALCNLAVDEVACLMYTLDRSLGYVGRAIGGLLLLSASHVLTLDIDHGGIVSMRHAKHRVVPVTEQARFVARAQRAPTRRY
jgi:hypothetical protein